MTPFAGKGRLKTKFGLLDRAGQLAEPSAATVVRVREDDNEEMVREAIDEIQKETGFRIDPSKVTIKFGPQNTDKMRGTQSTVLKPVEFLAILKRIKEEVQNIETRKDVHPDLVDIITSSREEAKRPIPVRPEDMFRYVKPSVYQIVPGLEAIMPPQIDKPMMLRDLFAMLSERSQLTFYPSGKYSEKAEKIKPDENDPIGTLKKFLNDKERVQGKKLPQSIIDTLFLGKGSRVVVEDLMESDQFEMRDLDLRLDEDCFILAWTDIGEGKLELRDVSFNLHHDKMVKLDPDKAALRIKKSKKTKETESNVVIEVYLDPKNRYLVPMVTNVARFQIVKVLPKL